MNKTYDPRNLPPRATPTNRGSGAETNTSAPPPPLRHNSTAAAYGKNLADLVGELHRHKEGDR